MVGRRRKWVESTRLLKRRRFLSLRDPQLEASIWESSPKASPRPPHTSTANRGYPVEWARQTRPKRPGMVPSIGGSGLALIWALFRAWMGTFTPSRVPCHRAFYAQGRVQCGWGRCHSGGLHSECLQRSDPHRCARGVRRHQPSTRGGET